MSDVRGRLAPSPTGELHLGGLATFLVAWLDARSRGGDVVLRMEDLDTPRVAPGAAERIVDDLRWAGLDWDEGPDVGGPFAPYRQSERADVYEAALAKLSAAGLTYLCDCSRAEIARVASAPHAGEEGPVYPGTCRAHGMTPRAFKRPPAIRFRAPDGSIRFVDVVHGEVVEDVARSVGDFVLKRGDGVYAYQLAVVVDDAAMRIDRVVRGADLLGSTARQLALFRALGETPPSYLHAPIVVGPDGARLAKRARGVPIADQRAAGRRPEEVLGSLAHTIGLADDDAPRSARDLCAAYDPSRLSRAPVPVPPRLAIPTSAAEHERLSVHP